MSTNVSLRSMFEDLEILADSEPSQEIEELHRQWEAELAAGNTASREKVDRVAAFIRQRESDIQHCRDQAAYYLVRAATLEKQLERLKQYAMEIVERHAPLPPLDGKGNPRHSKRLEGRAGWLAVQRGKPKLHIDADISRVYELATISGLDWKEVAALPEDIALRATWEPNRKLIESRVLDDFHSIHGVTVEPGKLRLALPPGKKGKA